VKRNSKSGFTLAEVMLTIAIVGIGLTLVVQGLSVSKVSALQTYNIKAARDLGLLTMGRIRAGLYQDELDSRLTGSYGEEGFEYFTFEVLLGDEQFEESEGNENSPFHDSYQAREEREDEADRESDSDDDEELEEDYEKVHVKVSFPPVPDYRNYVVLEEWIRWKQVYGSDEEEEGVDQ